MHQSIGDVPPAKAVTYVHRGKIEDDVIAFLQNGGTGAIVGVHAPGGQGKTELAKKADKEVRSRYEGTLWVDVGESTPEQVIVTMLLKCGVQVQPGANYEMQRNELRAHLTARRLLVILDDVRQEALEKIEDLLPPSPCACLVTSRIQQIGGVNQTFELDRMTPDQARQLLEAVLEEKVVAAEAEAAARLAERCKFNPLAIEIAARRIRQMKVECPIRHYFEKAEKRFDELKIMGDKHWDMTAIFDISYNDLTLADQKRFRALSVFHPTGFSPEAAAHVWSDESGEADVVISRFVNLSLVKGVEGKTERYRLHDLMDEYTAPLLAKSGEEGAARQALSEWLIELFDRHYTDDPSNSPEVEFELDNLKNSVEWAISRKDGELLALLATKPRNWLFNIFREWDAWRDWLEKSLRFGIADKEDRGKQLKANVLQAIGDVQQFRDDRDAALESYTEALKLFKAVGDRLGEANVLSSQGQMYLPDDLDTANEFLNRALQIYQKIGSQYSIPAQIGNYGWKLCRLGELEKAKPYLSQAADLFEKMGLTDYAKRHRKAAGE